MSRERYEGLMMKAVDGVITPAEQRELDAYLAEHPEMLRELDDFQLIKQTTDAMTDRILADARIEPVRPTAATRGSMGLGWALLLAGGLLLTLPAGYTLLADGQLPLYLRAGAALLALGGLVLLGVVLRNRLRARAHGGDPYQEIDR